MSYLQRQVNQRIQRERQVESQHNGIRQFLNQDRLASGHAHADLRVEGLRRQREEAVERNELFTDFCHAKQQAEQEQRKQISDAEERLAAELARKRAEESREAARRTRIIETSEELRALKQKLQAAAVTKGRAVQILDNQVREEEDQRREAAVNDYIEEERLRKMDDAVALEGEKASNNGRMLVDNKELGKERQRFRFEEDQDRLRNEREQVDSVVAKVMVEDEQEREERHKRKEEERGIMDFYLRQVQEKKAADERREREEEARIQTFMRRKQELEDEMARAQQQRDLAKHQQLMVIVGDHEERHRKEEEMRRLKEELHYEEIEEKHRQREAWILEKKRADAMQLRRDHEENVERKRQRELQREEEERRYREDLMAKFAEDERLEQMSVQKRRMKQQEHRREVDRMVQIRREKYEAERQRELEEARSVEENEVDKVRIIEEERQRLLAEHGPPLRNFLPPGTLAQQSDAYLVGGTPPPPPEDPGMRSAAEIADSFRKGAGVARALGARPATAGSAGRRTSSVPAGADVSGGRQMSLGSRQRPPSPAPYPWGMRPDADAIAKGSAPTSSAAVHNAQEAQRAVYAPPPRPATAPWATGEDAGSARERGGRAQSVGAVGGGSNGPGRSQRHGSTSSSAASLSVGGVGIGSSGSGNAGVQRRPPSLPPGALAAAQARHNGQSRVASARPPSPWATDDQPRREAGPSSVRSASPFATDEQPNEALGSRVNAGGGGLAFRPAARQAWGAPPRQ